MFILRIEYTTSKPMKSQWKSVDKNLTVKHITQPAKNELSEIKSGDRIWYAMSRGIFLDVRLRLSFGALISSIIIRTNVKAVNKESITPENIEKNL